MTTKRKVKGQERLPAEILERAATTLHCSLKELAWAIDVTYASIQDWMKLGVPKWAALAINGLLAENAHPGTGRGERKAKIPVPYETAVFAVIVPAAQSEVLRVVITAMGGRMSKSMKGGDS